MTHFLCLAGVCVASMAQPPVIEDGPHEATTVLLGGLRCYEASIESLAWEQRWYWPPNLSRANGPRSQWTLGERSTRYRDIEWRWFLDSTFTTFEPPEYRRVSERGLYIGGGGTRLAAGEESGWRGVLSTQDTFFIGGATLETLLGRGVDYSYPERGRLLSEMMALGNPVEYLPPTAEEPWPGLRAMKAVGNGWSNLDARIDPDLGFMPRLIRVWRSSDSAVSETAVTVESQEIDGIHVPRVAVRTGLSHLIVSDAAHPVTESVSADFALSLALDGLPTMNEATNRVVREWVSRGQRVRVLDARSNLAEGPAVWMSSDWGLISPVVLVIDWAKLNQSPEEYWSTDRFPSDTTIFNGFTSRREAVHDAMNIQRHWGPRVVPPDGAPKP